MHFFPKPLIYFGLLLCMASCQDYLGIPAEDGEKVRLKSVFTRPEYIPDSDTSYFSMLDFKYDALGRAVSMDIYNRDRKTDPYQHYSHHIFTYDASNRLEKETSDGPEALVCKYQYDALGRVTIVERLIATGGGNTQLLHYDLQNRVDGRVNYFYRGSGDTTTTSTETYGYTGNSTNISFVSQIYESQITPSFKRESHYYYDQYPNPLYKTPFGIFNSINYFNSPNNVDSISTVSIQPINSPIQPVTSSSSTKLHAQYENGLIIKQRSEQGTMKFEYEKY